MESNVRTTLVLINGFELDDAGVSHWGDVFKAGPEIPGGEKYPPGFTFTALGKGRAPGEHENVPRLKVSHTYSQGDAMGDETYI